ncbi:MAG TPA: hypothetical protein VMV69_04060, partial [Pirellulales bacterium]|nr:hypothetical protein [Pirellulales bacterium]
MVIGRCPGTMTAASSPPAGITVSAVPQPPPECAALVEQLDDGLRITLAHAGWRPVRFALARSKKEGLAANAGRHGGFGAAENAQEKTGKTVPVPTRKSVSADCPALD